jgi:ParB-like chromosome segregation protein Spo0J
MGRAERPRADPTSRALSDNAVFDEGDQMKIETQALAALKPYARNARTHSKRQIRQIAKSIERFGFCNPVLVDDEKQIIAGHGRAAAAKLLGMTTVPIVRYEY